MKLLPKRSQKYFLKIKERDVMLSQFTCFKKKTQTGRVTTDRFTSGQIYKSFINYIFHLDTLAYRNSRITILHCNIHQETGK